MSNMGWSRFARRGLTVLALVVTTFVDAQAAVVVDTYGSDGIANGSGYSLYADTTYQNYQKLAVPFALSQTMHLDNLLATIAGTGAYKLGIALDVDHLPTESFIYSLDVQDPQTVSVNLDWVLPAGDYWLVALPGPYSSGMWIGGGYDLQLPFAFANDRQSWMGFKDSDAPAMRLLATAVPEPGEAVLGLLGLASLATVVPYQRRKIRSA